MQQCLGSNCLLIKHLNSRSVLYDFEMMYVIFQFKGACFLKRNHQDSSQKHITCDAKIHVCSLSGHAWNYTDEPLLASYGVYKYGLTMHFIRTCIVSRSCHLHTVCRNWASQQVIVLHLSTMAPGTDSWKRKKHTYANMRNVIFLQTESDLDDYGRHELRGHWFALKTYLSRAEWRDSVDIQRHKG